MGPEEKLRARLARLLRGRRRRDRDGQPRPVAEHLRRPADRGQRGRPGRQGRPARQDHGHDAVRHAAAGGHAWWSGRGDDLDQRLTRTSPRSAPVTVTASAWYDIEAGLRLPLRRVLHRRRRDLAPGRRAGRPAVARRVEDAALLLQGRRARRCSGSATPTDGGVNEAGAFLDDITVKSGRRHRHRRRRGRQPGLDRQPTGAGRSRPAPRPTSRTRYYLIENRQYVGYDETLGQGAYQYCCAYTKPNWVELFQFRPGMLVWLVDHSYEDNNTSQHPGGGLALPVDARPAPFAYPDGTRPSNRRQPFDAAFGLETVPRDLPPQGGPGRQGRQPDRCRRWRRARPRTPASRRSTTPTRCAYWSAANPQNSVKVAGAGVTATVTGGSGGFLTVEVRGARP